MRNIHHCLVACSISLVALLAACGDDGALPVTSSSGAGDGGSGGGDGDGDGGRDAAPSSSSAATSGSTSSAASSQSSSGSAGPGSGGAGSGGEGPGSGGAGQGGAGGGWPECLIENFGGEEQSVLDVWSDDPSASTVYWLPGVIVTAVSGGGCVADEFCQLFVQQQESFDDLNESAHQAIKVLVAPEVALYFEGIGVGDRVDLGGEAYRDTSEERNELRFFVRESAPGCMDIVGSGDPMPVDATLVDLTQAAYEEDLGPVLVRMTTVSGRPHQPERLFALWDSEEGPDDGGIETVTNASPFFIPGGLFVALMPEQIVDFASVTGVYGQYYREDNMTRYETIYMRNMGDAPLVQ